MLTQLRIENFKSWRDTGSMRCAPLTAFFGPNSSGKTSILQFLLMLKQTIQSSDQSIVLELGSTSREAYVNLGVFSEVIHHKNQQKTISFHLAWRSETLPDFEAPFGASQGDDSEASFANKDEYDSENEVYDIDNNEYDSEDYGYNTQFSFSAAIREDANEKIELERFDYLVEKYFQLSFRVDAQNPHAKERGFDRVYILGISDKMNDESNSVTLSPRFLSPSKFYNFRILQPIPLGQSYLKYISESSSQFESVFRSIWYLGPLRDYPKRYYLRTGNIFDGVGSRGELTIPALLDGTVKHPFQLSLFEWNESERELDAQQIVAQWLQKLNLIHGFRLAPLAEGRREYEVRVRQTTNSPEVLLTEVGFGVSQVLPVLTQCFCAPSGSILIFEQPEIHLHPAIQSGLADVFVDVIKNRGIQIILESHSEHLLRRLQRRLAEEELLPSDIALYFTNIVDGESKLEELQVDSFGNISNWPNNFFGDEMGDLVAMVDAALHRQMNNGNHQKAQVS